MSDPRLPILVSVPHGGTVVPPEVADDCLLSLQDILEDGDVWSGRLYDVGARVAFRFEAEVARAVVDLNRAPDDRPPANPDGVVKTATVLGRRVWRWPEGPPPDVVEDLLAGHHHPYHEALARAASSGRVRLALDCHTMLPHGPPGAPDAGRPRPLVCLGNRGGPDGEEAAEPVTAPPGLLRALASALERRMEEARRALGEVPEEAPVVALNQPFRGGHIARRHGRAGSLPWIQVEFNRCLYLPREGEIRREPGPAEARRLQVLCALFIDSLCDIVGPVVRRGEGGTAGAG